MKYIILFNSPKFGGGLEKVVRMILTYYSEEKKKQLVLICCDSSKGAEFMCCGVGAVNFPIKRHGMIDSLFLYSRLKYSFKVYRYCKNNLKDGDIVNVHNGEGISFFLSLFRRRITAQFIFTTTLHGSLLKLFTRMMQTFPKKFCHIRIIMVVLLPYYWVVEYVSFKNIDYFVFITKKMCRYVRRYYRKNFEYTIINNGMNILPQMETSVKSHKYVKTALIVGSKTYLKGLDVAIATITQFNEGRENQITLNIIGFDDYEHYYRSKKMPSFINYIGQVNYKNMQQYYESADFLIFPSRSEEFASLVVLESLQYGLPIIVSRACNINEMNGYQKWGYQVWSYEIKYWCQAVEKMITDDNYQKFVANIRHTNYSRYQWNIVSKKYEELFDNL